MEKQPSKSRGSPEVYHGGGIYARHNERDGRTYYFIRYMGPDGRRKKEKTGTRKSDAVALLEQRKTEIRQGTYRVPIRTRGRKRLNGSRSLSLQTGSFASIQVSDVQITTPRRFTA